MKGFWRSSMSGWSVTCLVLGLVAATTARAEDARAWLGYQEPLRTLREPGDVRWLSGPKAGDALDIAIGFLREHRAALRLSDSDLAGLSLQKRYVTADTGVTHLYLLQQHAGIDVLGAFVTINVANDGSVINVGCATVPNLKQSVRQTLERMPAPSALELAARHVGLRLDEPARILRRQGGASDKVILSSGGLRAEVPARLVYQPVGPGSVRLAWRLDIDEFHAGHLWGISVDAEDAVISTDVRLAGAALKAGAACEMRFCGDVIAGLHQLHG